MRRSGKGASSPTLGSHCVATLAACLGTPDICQCGLLLRQLQGCSLVTD